VGDEHDRRVDLVLDPDQHLQDLGLHGHVERGGRLVGDEQVGLAGDRHGDHRPLAHAARELVGVHAGPLGGLGDADEVEHLDGGREGLAPAGAEVDAGHLADLPAHRVDRVQGGERVLEDHGDLLAAHRPPVGLVEGQQVDALPVDLAPLDLHGRQQAEDRHGGHRLAGAGLADDGEHLAPVDVERHAVHRLDHAVVGVEHGPQVADREQGGARRPWGRGRRFEVSHGPPT
jgi:hypothetical protein